MEAGEPDALDFYGGGLLTARWRQGRVMEILETLRQMVDDNPQLPAYRSALAGLLGDEGHLAEAAEMLSAAMEEGLDTRVNSAWSVSVSPWVLTAWAVRDVDAAARLYEMLAPWAGQVAAARTGAQRLIDMDLAALATLLGRHDDAEGHFADAERINTAFGAHGWNADNDVRHAVQQIAKGDRGAARAIAERARDRARATGYGLVERQAEAVLAELGSA